MLSPFLWLAVYIASFLNKKIRLRMNSYKFLLKDSIVKAKQTNKEISGEFLGRLVLGVEDGEIKIFGATIY